MDIDKALIMMIKVNGNPKAKKNIGFGKMEYT